MKYPPPSIATISKSLTNHEINVQAVISTVREPTSERAPYVVSLTEGTATLPLVFWSDIQSQIVAKLKTGNVIRVTALVSVYRDQLQLRLRSATALEVVNAAGVTTATTTTPPAETVIGKIKADWVDRNAIVSGTIAASDAIDKGQRLSVQDATGEIHVVLGEKVPS